MLNNLLIYGLINENHSFTIDQTLINNRIVKINLYIKWLIKNNMQVQYFDNKCLDCLKIEYDYYNVEMYKILWKVNHLILFNRNDNKISNNNLFRLLKNNQFNNLRILDLTCKDFSDEGFIKSTELKSIIKNNLNIQELILDGNHLIDDDCIMFIIENCEHLKFLSLKFCKLSDLFFTKLTKQNKNLIKLFIDLCQKLTDLSLTMISKIFLILQELSIENNNNITDQGLIDFASNCSTLLKLNIINCEKITDIGIIEITKILKNLNSFYSLNNITDESFKAISKNCLNLNVLNIYDCSMITNIGFNALSTTSLLKKLTELYFYDCDNLNDSNVIKMSEYFSNLQVLSLNSNQNFTDKSIIAITKNCKYLNTLIIDSCKKITNIGFESIAIYCFNLKFLSIEENINITEACLTKIINNCLKLNELTIDYCHNITKNFTEYLKKQKIFLNVKWLG
jgi:hypothetical protein